MANLDKQDSSVNRYSLKPIKQSTDKRSKGGSIVIYNEELAQKIEKERLKQLQE